MATIFRGGQNQNQEALGQGSANLGAGLGAFLVETVRGRKLNEQRTQIEEQIRNAPSYQDALTAIESAPHRVRSNFEQDLLKTAQARFPEQELIQALTPEGQLTTITQEKGRPLSDEQIREQGLEPARQFAIVSTGKGGDVEIHDTAIGQEGASEDLARLQEMFPDRTFQVAQGPEIETFDQIWARQLERRRAAAQEDTSARDRRLSPEEIRLFANIRQTIANDPLATETGATVLEDQRGTIVQRFRDFNGQFEGDIFSLEDPDAQALVQNGINVASTAVARGLSVEKATDLGFNNQILGRIVQSLSSSGSTIGADLDQEVERRFKVNAETLQETASRVSGDNRFDSLPEFNPSDPAIIGVPIAGSNIVLQFVKVGGVLVPFGTRSQ